MKLAELQTKLQAAIIEGDQAILASLAASPRADRETLLAVYYDAYRLRLAAFLSNDFPCLRSHLGDETFGRLVEDYIEAAPSHERNARWYAARLPDFMQATAPWRMKSERRRSGSVRARAGRRFRFSRRPGAFDRRPGDDSR